MPIGKYIPNPEKASSKAVRIALAAHYSQGKAIYKGSRNFQFEDLELQIAEMIGSANEAVLSKDTIDHFVISWQEGEQPTKKQVEECVDILLEEMGLKGCQVLYGLHDDTANIHLHFLTNRVDPETGKVRRIEKGFTAEAIQKVAAIIGHRQGWAAVPNCRYAVLENGECVKIKEDPDAPARPDQKAIDMEIRTGIKSAKTIAIEEAAPIIMRATNWQQLHARLNAKGFRFEKEGSGALIYIGETPVKASDASRGKTSLGAIQKRLGIYEPAAQRLSERHLVHTGQAQSSDRVLQDIPRNDRGRNSELDRNRGIAGNTVVGKPWRGNAENSERDDGRIRDGSETETPTADLKRRSVKTTSDEHAMLHADYVIRVEKFKEIRDQAKLDMLKRQSEEIAALKAANKVERDSVMKRDWKGFGKQMNAMASFLKGKQAGAMADLKDQHKAEKKNIAKSLENHFPLRHGCVKRRSPAWRICGATRQRRQPKS